MRQTRDDEWLCRNDQCRRAWRSAEAWRAFWARRAAREAHLKKLENDAGH